MVFMVFNRLENLMSLLYPKGDLHSIYGVDGTIKESSRVNSTEAFNSIDSFRLVGGNRIQIPEIDPFIAYVNVIPVP